MIATFHPQAWQDDNAVPADPEGPVSWRVTPAFLAELYAKHGEEVTRADTYPSDCLREDDAAPEWVRDWHGPFYVSLGG